MVNATKRYQLVEVIETENIGQSVDRNLEVLMYNNKLTVNVDEFSNLMGIGRENAMRLIERKDNPVPHKRVGNRIVISFPGLIKWLETWNRSESI